MAFCNNTTSCNHECGRQDDHGGNCDCYEESCSLSSRFKKPSEPQPCITLYAIKYAGKFYQTYHTGRGNCGWVDEVDDCTVYTRLRHAKTQLTRLINEMNKKEKKKDAVPELIELVVTKVKIFDQASQIAKEKLEKELQNALHAVVKLTTDLEFAKSHLEKIQKGK